MATLPIELVQEIIEASVEGGLSQAAVLARVSRGFHELARPLLCRTLMYYEERPELQWPVPVQDLPRWLEANGKYVRNVMWGIEVETLPNLFNKCPNVTNLAIWIAVSMYDLPPILPSLSTIHLTRLSLNIYRLLDRHHFSEDKAQHDAFQSITHLDMFHNIEQWKDIEGITSLPRLTHLRLPDNILSDDAFCHDAIDRALEGCKRLKVLVVIAKSTISRPERSQVVHVDDVPAFSSGGFDDPRLVAINIDYRADWECGAIRGKDFWAVADQVVKERLEALKDDRA